LAGTDALLETATMDSLLDVWNVAKPILEVGVVGALLFLMVRREGTKDKRLQELMEARVQDERTHGREILKMERDNHREMKELLKQYDMTLASTESTLESLAESLSDDSGGA
jgi:hypothetical protein